MPWMADAVSASMGTVLRAGAQTAHCVYEGFRDNFASASQCLRERGLHSAVADTWADAGRKWHHHRASAGGMGAGVLASADVAFACALSALTIGAVHRCLSPEWRELEAAFASGEQGQRRWGVQTDAQLHRRTLGDVTAMRQCLTAFEATNDAYCAPPRPVGNSPSARSRKR